MSTHTRTIPLTRGKVAIVDDADFEWLSQWKWQALHQREGNYYAVRSEPDGVMKQRTVYMHRQIADAPAQLQIDHINHDKLDNRRANLRLCSSSENARNVSSRRGATSAYLGVSWHKASRKWLSQIHINKLCVYLGTFESEMDAALAYDRAALKHFGEFANPNF